MAYILWLVFMGLLIGFLAVPLAQRFGYAYGRFGRMSDMLLVIVGAVIGGVLVTALGGAIGASTGGDGGAIVGGIIGAVISVALLALLSTRAANKEPNTQEDIAG